MPGSGTDTGDSKQKKFSVKLNVREGTTCKELRQIKGRIAKILHVKMAVLIIVNVDPGCVQLTFLIPKFIAQEIFPLSHEQASALSKETPVIRLECGDYVFEVLGIVMCVYMYLVLALVLLFKFSLNLSEFIDAICIHSVPVWLIQRIKVLNHWS